MKPDILGFSTGAFYLFKEKKKGILLLDYILCTSSQQLKIITQHVMCESTHGRYFY